jgi:Xaa-Pro dipeptidase
MAMKINHIERQQKLIARLKNEGLDLAVITAPSNIYYMTGFFSDPHERYMSLIIDVLCESTYLFLPALDKEAANQVAKVNQIIPISDGENPFSIIKNSIDIMPKVIGIETDFVSVSHHDGLKNIFTHVSFVNIRPYIDNQRIFKSKEEINGLKEAVTIIERVLEDGLRTIKNGMTETELVAQFEFLMKKYGAVGPSFATMVLSGEKSALPHGEPGIRKLQNGDFLLIDFGVMTRERYCSDITRTFIIGEASEKQKEIYNIVRTSTQAGVKSVKKGKPLKNFDIAARNVIEKNGYGNFFNNRVGHGLGIEVHETPSIHHLNEELAETGMVFTIEPGIYIPDYGGVRIEEEVYINENGEAEVLTNFPTELRIVDLK